MINLLISSKSQITGDQSVIFLKFEVGTTSPNLKIGFCNLHPKKIIIYICQILKGLKFTNPVQIHNGGKLFKK